jgi:hypothetical protein
MRNTDTGVVTNINVTRDASRRVRQIARLRGMLIYRALDMVLEGWDMLTAEQQHEAHRRSIEKNQPAAASA